MPENYLYEYAVLRLVPRVEREEFINIGVILYCQSKQFLAAQTHIDLAKIDCIAPEIDIAFIEEYLCKFQLICQGNAKGGIIATLPLASRFRWLTATRSTIIQSSKVHPGFTTDPQATLEKLMEKLVK